jgi:hypothetical protein
MSSTSCTTSFEAGLGLASACTSSEKTLTSLVTVLGVLSVVVTAACGAG